MSCCHLLASLPSRSSVPDDSVLIPHLFRERGRNGGMTKAGLSDPTLKSLMRRHKQSALSFHSDTKHKRFHANKAHSANKIFSCSWQWQRPCVGKNWGESCRFEILLLMSRTIFPFPLNIYCLYTLLCGFCKMKLALMELVQKHYAEESTRFNL